MRYLFVFVYVFTAFWSLAQEDTVWLQEVQVAGVFEKYTQSAHFSAVDSSLAVRFQTSDLGTLLQSATGLYLRQYGAEGQLTSVSFRGTTPNHTQVNWQGIDINSQTLGQSDFSGIPSFLFSDIELYHGAASTLYGSGAIGGVIRLEDRMPSQSGIALTQQIGSYGKFFTGIKAHWNSPKWALKVAMVRDHIDNDFDVSFRNETYKQNNAENNLQAVSASVARKFSSSKLQLAIWYNHHHRQIQPIISDVSNTDQLEDNNLRTVLTYEKALKSVYYKLSSAWIDDQQIYNLGSEYNVKRLVESAEIESGSWKNWNIRSGLKYTLALPDVASYQDKSQLQLVDWFGLSSYQISKSNLDLQLRIPYMSLYDKTPIIPSIGYKWSVLDKKKVQLTWQNQVARSFRFPTLNDLFWQPGGNRNLKPEDGINLETGFSVKMKNWSLQSQIYRSWLSQMIVWTPSGAIWSPKNITSVKIFGNESTLNIHAKWNKSLFSFQLNHAYNQSLDTSGNQLPYVPNHKLAGIASATRNKWTLFTQLDYTGLRYTQASKSSVLSAYQVMSAGLEKLFRIQNHEVQISFQVRNLLDAEYQNYELRAVPGRNYFIKLNYQIINNEKR